jgi:transposase-like protein
MTTEKETEIINALQGITYKDWELISSKVELIFDKKAASQKKQLLMAAPEIICKPYYEIQDMLL